MVDYPYTQELDIRERHVIRHYKPSPDTVITVTVPYTVPYQVHDLARERAFKAKLAELLAEKPGVTEQVKDAGTPI